MFKYNNIGNESKLIDGYKNRIRTFIFNMIEKPYKIQYLEAKNNFSFRPQEQNKKGNIKIKPFVPDKIRIEKYLKAKQEESQKFMKNKSNQKNKNILNISFDDNNSSISSKDENRCFSEKRKTLDKRDSSSSSNRGKYLQPIMKFKPRTDLERIFDTINSNYYGKIDRNLVNEQLKSLGLVTVYNKKYPKQQNEYSLLREKLKVSPQTLNYLIKEKERLEQGPKTKEINELISNIENIIHINKEMTSEKIQKNFSFSGEKSKIYRNKRRNLNNFLAKNILSEYQKKTHFKALCTCSLDLDDSYKKKDSNLENSKDVSKSGENYNSLNSFNSPYTIKITEKKKNLKYNSILYKRPFHNKKKYNKEQLNYLKNLFCLQKDVPHKLGIFETQKKMYAEDNEINNKLIRQANNVLINGKFYNKNDLKSISCAVLKECNYIKKYFNSENAGEGKTMITRGMSVNEFSKKYGLPK